MTTGSGSSFPLMRLAARYNKMMKDGVVLSNRAAIDILDTRITELLSRIDAGEAPNRLSQLYELWQEYLPLMENGKLLEAGIVRKKISDVFEKVYHDYAAWNQIFTALDLRGKTVEREVKVLTAIKAIMTVEDGYKMLAKALAATIKIIGDDPRKLKELQYEYTRLIGESSDLAGEGIWEDAGGGSEEERGETGSGDMDQEEFLHPRDEK